MLNPALRAKIKEIELLLLDVDGTLTDGQIIYTDQQQEIKAFHVRDGLGIRLWQSVGKHVAIITGRVSMAVTHRAKELGITHIIQGAADKVPALEQILQQTGLQAQQVCAMGDDLPDFPMLKRCGIAVAVADAVKELRDRADYVTTEKGGRGAVREAIEWLLHSQGRWQAIIQQYQKQ